MALQIRIARGENLEDQHLREIAQQRELGDPPTLAVEVVGEGVVEVPALVEESVVVGDSAKSDALGGVVGDASGVVMPIGSCSGGADRGRVVVTAMSSGNQPIASAAMSLSQGTLVWVIDDFTFVEGGVIATERSTWGRIKALYPAE